MIKIAHEVPVALMKTMQQYTDYDYALACLFDKVPGYYDYFVEALKNGRHVLLDNGVFEDGIPMDSEQYSKWILKLQPTEYIVPDVFDDPSVTIKNFHEWLQKYNDLPGKKIGVVQGQNFTQLWTCYEYMTSFADKIAINFASVGYQIHAKQKSNEIYTWDEAAVFGRQEFIKDLILTNNFKKDKPHHLLGCSLPKEFYYYSVMCPIRDGKRYIDYFESMDTSAPIVWGILSGKYPDNLDSIKKKNKTKLKDLITSELSEQQKYNIIYNTSKFREYVRDK